MSTIFDSGDASLYDIRSKAPGPRPLPLTPNAPAKRPSGDLFGWTQNAGMGWDPAALGGTEILILSTHGGIRAADGTPVALGYHTGHWEVGPADRRRRRRS
jgi:xylonate dehydratase